MIVVIDYGMGNIGSIVNMLKKVNTPVCATSDADVIHSAEKLILPGVGSFDRGMKNISGLRLIDVLETKINKDKIPVLGICLGMQLMFESSEEGEQAGLGLFEGTVKKFDNRKYNLRIPHMGWNKVNITKPNDRLFTDLPIDQRYYFVHSYYVETVNTADILTTTCYGLTFTSSVSQANIWGVQFHPEKSHRYGMQLLKNFSEI